MRTLELMICCSQWLLNVFLKYLDDWEESVAKREGFTTEEKKVMILSHETLLGLRITGKGNSVYIQVKNVYIYVIFIPVHSFVELARYLLNIPEVDVFLSNKVSQDPIEKFFGQQRQRGSSNDNPNALQFIKGTQAIRVINTTCANIRGNCRGDKAQKWIPDNKSLPKRKTRRNG